jgi:hypothetical protein
LPDQQQNEGPSTAVRAPIAWPTGVIAKSTTANPEMAMDTDRVVITISCPIWTAEVDWKCCAMHTMPK